MANARPISAGGSTARPPKISRPKTAPKLSATTALTQATGPGSKTTNIMAKAGSPGPSGRSPERANRRSPGVGDAKRQGEQEQALHRGLRSLAIQAHGKRRQKRQYLEAVITVRSG